MFIKLGAARKEAGPACLADHQPAVAGHVQSGRAGANWPKAPGGATPERRSPAAVKCDGGDPRCHAVSLHRTGGGDQAILLQRLKIGLPAQPSPRVMAAAVLISMTPLSCGADLRRSNPGKSNPWAIPTGRVAKISWEAGAKPSLGLEADWTLPGGLFSPTRQKRWTFPGLNPSPSPPSGPYPENWTLPGPLSEEPLDGATRRRNAVWDRRLRRL